MRYKYILDKNDMIFVVCPIWWYGLPMPMYSFFDEYDFSGKTIIPAVTHKDSRLSGTPDDIAEIKTVIMCSRTATQVNTSCKENRTYGQLTL